MQTKIDNIITNYEVLDSKSDNSKGSILILHGWGRSLNEWVPLANKLNEEYQIFMLDLPGFGKTQPSNTPWDTNNYADFVISFIEKLNIKSPILLGHSYGGKISILIASQRHDLRKIILVAASGINIRTLKTNVTITLARIFKPISKILPENVVYKLQNKFRDADYKTAGELKDTLSNILKEDFTNILKKIKCETLIIWGNRDDVLPVSLTKIFRREITNSKVRIVWGAKHDPHLEKPDIFTEIIKENI